ncbi:MAG: S49 family peptidase [Myxococcales bacterium]|nr:S49 family peptidase [Myxococcales bacterium]
MRPAQILAIATLLAACEGRPRRQDPRANEAVGFSRNEPHLAEFDLRGGVREEPDGTLLTGLPEPSHADLVAELGALDGSVEPRGIFVRLGSASLGMAQAEELGRLFGRLREKKLPVVCHADGYGNATMLFAARACTEVWLSRAGGVETVGLAAQLMFGRELFDKLGVQVDFLQVGRFKGASDAFMRNDPSEDARQSLALTLSSIRAGWLDGIERGRGRAADDLGIEDGPHVAPRALELGLVDAIGFEEEAQNRAAELAGKTPRVVYFGAGAHQDGGLGAVLRAVVGAPAPLVPHIAVVRATGAVTMGGSSPLGGGNGISYARLAPLFRKLADDPLTRAVVLRIDSPGGSALASDLLWQEVRRLRAKKPVVASIGGMAASGGYYIASAANTVLAERSSIVGSIGVVMGKLSIGASLERIGVHVTVVPAKEGGGTRALYGSPFVPWDDATRAKLTAATTDIYDLFVARVAEGRGTGKKVDIANAAEGRIMSGAVGRELGLVDELGGLADALGHARSLAGLDEGTKVVVVGHGMGFLGLFADRSSDAGQRELTRERAATLRAVDAVLSEVLPLGAEFRAFAATFAPLAHGENVLAALPYAFTLR